MPVIPLSPTPTIAVDTAVSPCSKSIDRKKSRESHLDGTVSSEIESIEVTAFVAGGPINDTPSWQSDGPSPPKYTHASVQELQGIREMFCRTTEEEGQVATDSIDLTRYSSPVPAKQGAATPQSKSSTVTPKDGVDSTRTSSPISTTPEEAPTPIKSSKEISTDQWTDSIQSSPSISTRQGEATTPSESPMITSPGGLIGSSPSSSPASVKPWEVSTPLKSSIAKSGDMAKTKPAHIPPSKGWIDQLVSSVKMKKRASPLREIYNGANERQMKTSKNARFSENPVSATKRFIKNETISYPSPISSRDENSILSQASSLDILQMSPTQQEQDAMIAEQLVCSTPGIIGYATEKVCESDTGLSLLANYDHPGRPDSQSNERSESSQKLPTENEPSGQMIEPKHDRSASPAPHSSHDHQSSPTDSEASGQVNATPTKVRDFNPTTPPGKLSEAFDNLTISGRRSSRRTQEKRELSEKRRLEQEAIAAEEKVRKDKAEADDRARRQAEEEEERKKYARRIPIEKVIQPLTEKWENSVTAALAQVPSKPVARTIKGTEILRRDIGFVLPQRGTKDDPRGYLNDAIIDAYLLAIVDRGNRIAGHKRGETPKMHAFSNFFYDNLSKKGPESVKRWASKAKIGGKDLLKAEWIFIPICESLHWTLFVVSGTRKTIEYFDSLNMHVMGRISVVKNWLKSELANGYKDEEWKVVEDPEFPGRGKGPHQNNGSDCGVFVITSAKMISLEVDPMTVLPTDMSIQRRRLIAELINGGFTNDFEPKIVFE